MAVNCQLTFPECDRPSEGWRIQPSDYCVYLFVLKAEQWWDPKYWNDAHEATHSKALCEHLALWGHVLIPKCSPLSNLTPAMSNGGFQLYNVKPKLR